MGVILGIYLVVAVASYVIWAGAHLVVTGMDGVTASDHRKVLGRAVAWPYIAFIWYPYGVIRSVLSTRRR